MARRHPRALPRPAARSHRHPGAGRRARALLIALPAAVLLLLVAACGRGEEASARGDLPELLPIPGTELPGAASGVQEQLRERRERIDTLAAAAPVDRAALAEAWIDLGLTYLLYDLLDAAEVGFENARRLQPEAFRPLYLLGYLDQLQGRLDTAIPRLEEAREIEPDYPPVLLRLGRALLDRAEPDAAEPLFAKALELDPRSAAALDGLARVAAARGDDARAIELWERALEMQPRADSLHYVLGQAWRRLGDVERAREELAQAGDVAVHVADPILNPLAGQAASAQFFLVQGGEAMDDERWSEAIGAYERAIELDPAVLRPYIAIAFAREQLGDREGAARSLRAGLEQAEAENVAEEASVHRYLGRVLVILGRDEEAVAHLERSLELLPGQPPVRLDLADARARSGDWEAALAILDELLAAEGGDAAELLARKAAVLVNLGRADAAFATYRRALGVDDDPELRLRYAAALEHFGRAEEARQERRRAEERAGSAGDPASLALAEGRRLEAAGRLEAALAAYDRATRLAPERAEARVRKGNVLGHLGRLEEARDELAAAVAAAPEAREPRRSEIVSLILLGRYGEARVKLNEALRRFPLDVELARISARLLAAAPDPAVRDGQLAVRQAVAIMEAHPDPVSAEILAMAFAEAGQPARAEALQRQVVQAVQSGGDLALLAPMRERLLQYQRGEPWRASRPEDILSSPLETDAGHG